MRFQFQSHDLNHRRFPGGLWECAEAYLNDRLGDRYYGPGLMWVALAFHPQPPRRRELNSAWRYAGSFAEHLRVEALGEDRPKRELTANAFRTTLEQARTAVLAAHDLHRGAFQDDDFQRDFSTCLAAAPATDDQLREFSTHIEAARARAYLKLLRGEEAHRLAHPRPLDKPLAGLRWRAHGRLAGRLEPLLTCYCQLFEGLLREFRLMCPTYREIYFSLAETDDEARRHRAALEEWHEDAYAVVSADAYDDASELERGEMLTNALADALRELARLDHLDREPIERAVAQIRATGLETDLTFLSAENEHYEARVLYRVSPPGEPPAFRLRVRGLESGRVGEVDLGRHDLMWLPYRFARLSLMAKQARIEAGKGERARVYLKSIGAPARLCFTYDELFGR